MVGSRCAVTGIASDAHLWRSIRVTHSFLPLFQQADKDDHVGYVRMIGDVHVFEV
jgi:hypothetical protein